MLGAAALSIRAEQAIIRLAQRYRTNSAVRILVLGSYDSESKPLLKKFRSRLRLKPRYTAFLEDEIDLSVSFEETCRTLARLSTFVVFIVTTHGRERGWQVELSDLVREDSGCLEKLGFYCESFRALPSPVRDLLMTHRIYQSDCVYPDDVSRTIRTLEQNVNTFVLGLSRVHESRTIQ